MVKLCGKPIRVNKSSQDKNSMDVGANLFVGNLDSEADEKLLYDTFSAFGLVIKTPKVSVDVGSPLQRGDEKKRREGDADFSFLFLNMITDYERSRNWPIERIWICQLRCF